MYVWRNLLQSKESCSSIGLNFVSVYDVKEVLVYHVFQWILNSDWMRVYDLEID